MEDTSEFREARIACGDQGAGVGVMGGLRGPDGMRAEGTVHNPVTHAVTTIGLTL